MHSQPEFDGLGLLRSGVKKYLLNLSEEFCERMHSGRSYIGTGGNQQSILFAEVNFQA